jgi:hypothetical protein
LPLRELSKRSAQFGAWSVVVQQAKVEHYEYQYQGQKKWQGVLLRHRFVGRPD